MKVKIDKELNYHGMEGFLKVTFSHWQLRIYNPFTSAFEFIQSDCGVVITRFWFIDVIYFGDGIAITTLGKASKEVNDKYRNKN